MRLPAQVANVLRGRSASVRQAKGIVPSLCANEGDCGPCINGRQACCIGGHIVRMPCDEPPPPPPCCNCSTVCTPPGCRPC